jgi:hypothetical protein
MSATYSINVGTITESLRKTDIYSALIDLPDNVQKKISPKDLRDAIFTSWASAAFKLTTPDAISTEYIGIDSANPEDRDIKKKILLGKRTVGNLDVVSDALLNTSDADIFFYNTKPESVSQNQTKISILAGTDSSLFYTAPFIAASYSLTQSAINLDIKNPSLAGGAINIYSSTGRVGINGVAFPTVAETNATASNGKILKYYGTYPNGFLRWADPDVTTSVIGSTGSPTYIYGSSSYVNGYPLEFIVNGQVVPETIGGILQGDSFTSSSYYSTINSAYQNWPIVEVIRKLLYPYIAPDLSITAVNNVTGTTYAEVGTTPSITLNFSIKTYARDSNEYIRDYYIVNSVTYSTPTFSVGGYSYSAAPGNTLILSASGSTYSSATGSIDYGLQVSNQWIAPWGYSYSATASINFIQPFVSAFVGTSSLDFLVVDGTAQQQVDRADSVRCILTGVTISSTKKIVPYPGLSQSINMDVDGSGYLYFAYPSTYGYLKYIKDPNGFYLHDYNNFTYSSFTYSNSITIATPYTYFGNYYLYRTLGTCSYIGVGEFEFIF